MDTTLYDAHARLDDEHWWFLGRRSIVRDALKRHLHPFPGTRRILDAWGTAAKVGFRCYFDSLQWGPFAAVVAGTERERATGWVGRISDCALTKLFSAARHDASQVPVSFDVPLLAIATRPDSSARGST